MKKVGLLMLVLFLFLAGILLYFSGSFYVGIRTKSLVTEYDYKVNTAKVNWYLHTSYYNSGLDNLLINFVSDSQQGFAVVDEDRQVLQSVSAGRQGKDLVLNIQYTPEQIQKVGGTRNGFARDLYMYLCLALDPGKPNPNECYQKADEHIAREKWLPMGEAAKIVKKTQKVGWFNFLVREAYAQSCGGTIPCGGWELDAFGNPFCNLSANNLNCNGLSTQMQCENLGNVGSCAIACNSIDNNFCTWNPGGEYGRL